MYNYILTRLAYWPILLILFVSGICMGSVLALILMVLDHSIGVLGAAFLSLLAGLFSSLVGFIHVVVFNTVASSLGGLPVKVEAIAAAPPDDQIIDPPDLPSY